MSTQQPRPRCQVEHESEERKLAQVMLPRRGRTERQAPFYRASTNDGISLFLGIQDTDCGDLGRPKLTAGAAVPPGLGMPGQAPRFCHLSACCLLLFRRVAVHRTRRLMLAALGSVESARRRTGVRGRRGENWGSNRGLRGTHCEVSAGQAQDRAAVLHCSLQVPHNWVWVCGESEKVCV